MRALSVLLVLLAGAGAVLAAGQNAGLDAMVSKPSVDVRSQPDFSSARVATLKRNAPVKIAAQQGLWYRLALPDKPGYVRVNDVRVAYAGTTANGGGVLFAGKSGAGRASETAGVRGLDENDLRTAYANGAQLAKMESYRVSPATASAYAGSHRLADTPVAYATELQPVGGKNGGMTQAQKKSGFALARGLLSQIGGGLGSKADSAADVAESTIGKSEVEQSEEELTTTRTPPTHYAVREAFFFAASDNDIGNRWRAENRRNRTRLSPFVLAGSNQEMRKHGEQGSGRRRGQAGQGLRQGSSRQGHWQQAHAGRRHGGKSRWQGPESLWRREGKGEEGALGRFQQKCEAVLRPEMRPT